MLLPNAARTHHAVWRGNDKTKEPSSFHRMLGGSVEFGERSVDAAVREMREELGIELIEPRLLGALENVYKFRGEPGHEVVFVYTGSTSTDVVPVRWRVLRPRSLRCGSNGGGWTASAKRCRCIPTGVQALINQVIDRCVREVAKVSRHSAETPPFLPPRREVGNRVGAGLHWRARARRGAPEIP